MTQKGLIRCKTKQPTNQPTASNMIVWGIPRGVVANVLEKVLTHLFSEPWAE